MARTCLFSKDRFALSDSAASSGSHKYHPENHQHLGRTAEDHARHAMQLPVWHEPHDPPKFTGDAWRGAGVVEGSLALFRDYRAAGGTWKRYVAEPRKQLLALRRLVERGRAAPPGGTLARVQGLPDVLFWKVHRMWSHASFFSTTACVRTIIHLRDM